MASGLSQSQRAALFAAARKAAGTLGEDREEYRKRVMREELGVDHLADVGRGRAFDRLMMRMAADAGDYSSAMRYELSDAARVAYLVKVCCLQLMQLKGGDEADAGRYLGGLLDQARVPNGVYADDGSIWIDLAPSDALAVFKMLDTHRRRMLRDVGSRVSVAFSDRVSYSRLGDSILVRTGVGADYYAGAPLNVVFQPGLPDS